MVSSDMKRKTAFLGLGLFLLNSQQAVAPAAGSPGAKAPPGKTATSPIAKSAASKKDCNAFTIWSELSQMKRPDPPSGILAAALIEGQRLPSGDEARQLNAWMQEMEPLVAIARAGCACSRASIVVTADERIGSFEWMKLSYACKFHQVKAKQFMAAGQFSNVPQETGDIFRISRTAFSSKPLAFEFMIYCSVLRQGLASIRECLHWRKCPDAVLNELPALMDGIDYRRCTARTMKEECEFMVSSLAKECRASDFLSDTDDDFGINIAHTTTNAGILRGILKKRKTDFNLDATSALFRDVAAEAEKNAMLPVSNRSELIMNTIRKELSPMIEAFKEDQNPLFAPFTELALSNQLAKVQNLLGKVLVLNVLSREPDSRDFFSALVADADLLELEMEGTRILVALSRYERAKHELPKSLDAIAADLHKERWPGYELNYSKESRTLQFKLGSGVFHKTADGKDHLTWTIPRADLQ